MYVVADDAVREAIAVLPADLLPAMAELRAALELAPWSVGSPLISSNPHGLRVVGFGERERAQVVYGVIDRDRLVSLLQLSWV